MSPKRPLPLAPPGPRPAGRALSIVFVMPFGEPREGFFPDALMELCCAEARALGHRASVVRVYYDGHNEETDARVRARLSAYLAERDADVTVVERLFDPSPVLAHVRDRGGRLAVMLSWGDGDLIEGIDLVVGRTPGTTRTGATRRSPSAGELVGGFVDLLTALSTDGDMTAVPGVATITGGVLRAAAPGSARPLPRPFRPAIDHEVIAPGDAPPITRKYLFGNAGCPFADDPRENEHYRSLDLPDDGSISRLGCAFCHAGGDYQKRRDEEVVDELVEQAAFYQAGLPALDELVIVDQYAVRFLERLVRTASARGLRPTRWLFSSRADAFVRERERIRGALAAARETGNQLEVYLSGFESFSDAELRRYNKGVTVDELVRSVATMRALAAEWPDAFRYDRARGHSTILWSPWTTPDDLLDTVSAVRVNRLRDLFDEVGRNRLRLYPDLPIFRAADRDGALLEAWSEGDEGEARRKGYSVEQPWRFLDERTRLAHGLANGLRERLGPTTEMAQIAAAAAYARDASLEAGEAPTRERAVLDGVTRLSDTLARVKKTASSRFRSAASPVAVSGNCNNGCATCSHSEAWTDDREAALAKRIAHARSTGRAVLFAGREPTLHPDFARLVGLARGDDERAVGVVTNGRLFSYEAFTRAARRAGLVAASIKVFAPDAAVADAIARVEGAWQQAITGARKLAALGVASELRVPLHRENLQTLTRYADLARDLGMRQLRIETDLDALGLDSLGAAEQAVDELLVRSRALGLVVDASPLRSGARCFDFVPSAG